MPLGAVLPPNETPFVSKSLTSEPKMSDFYLERESSIASIKGYSGEWPVKGVPMSGFSAKYQDSPTGQSPAVGGAEGEARSHSRMPHQGGGGRLRKTRCSPGCTSLVFRHGAPRKARESPVIVGAPRGVGEARVDHGGPRDRGMMEEASAGVTERAKAISNLCSEG